MKNTNLDYLFISWAKFLTDQPLFHKVLFFNQQSPDEAAEGIIYAALSGELESRGGLYLDNCKCVKSSKLSYNIDDQWILWTWTKDFIKSLHEFLEGDYPEGFDRA